MADSRDEEELVARIEELEAALTELREDDAPPAPVTRNAHTVARLAIPATIAVLKANIRVLESVAHLLHEADGDPSRSRDRTVLEELSEALSPELREAIEPLDQDDAARTRAEDVHEILSEAHELRDLLDTYLREAEHMVTRAERDRSEPPSVQDDEADHTTFAEPTAIDIDAELESIKRETDEREDRSLVDSDDPADGTTHGS